LVRDRARERRRSRPSRRSSGLGACQRPTSVHPRWRRPRMRQARGQPQRTQGAAAAAQLMAALAVEVRRLKVEAHTPAGTMPADGGRQDLGPGRHDRLPSVEASLCDGTKQPPQPAGVIVNPERADPWQSHRAGTDLTNPDMAAAALALCCCGAGSCLGSAPFACASGSSPIAPCGLEYVCRGSTSAGSPFAPSHSSLLTLAVGVPAILLDRRL
jgi:hypothetical protein